MKPEPRTILFVEDEPLLGELMTEALADKGFEVEVAPDAGHALRYLLSGAEVDVLFTDIDLGAGMDGATLARLARAMRPELPVAGTWQVRIDLLVSDFEKAMLEDAISIVP